MMVVTQSDSLRESIFDLLESSYISIVFVSTGGEAYGRIKAEHFHCLILDPDLPDTTGIQFLYRIRNDSEIPHIPVIVYSERDLKQEERAAYDEHSERILIKDERVKERLLDEVVLFLHYVEANLPEEKQKMLQLVHDKESILHDKKLLIVDDDMRNVYALTNILESKGLDVISAKNGLEALAQLAKKPDVDLVLMDIMMPEMDGYEAMNEIRKQEAFRTLPIIALTAKAMKDKAIIKIDFSISFP